jgi:biopolymer transport protein ExbB
MFKRLACGFVALALGVALSTCAVIAQDEKKAEPQEAAKDSQPEGEMKEQPEPEPKPEPEPDPDMAAPAEEPAAPAAAPTDTPAPTVATEAPAQENYVVFLIRAGGPIGAFILLQSFVTVGLTVKYTMELRRDKFIPPALLAEFENKLRDKKYQEAYEVSRGNPSFLGKVLAAGLSKLSAGYSQAVEAMQEAGEEESMRVEHKLSWLALMGTTGPLLGLFGTVVGMVDSFRVIATSETQPKPSQLADGISVALITTLDGMVVAIVATFAFLLLKNQAARLVLEVGMISSNLMGRFSSTSRSGRGGTTPGTSEAP